MDNPTLTIADQVAALESAKGEAEDRVEYMVSALRRAVAAIYDALEYADALEVREQPQTPAPSPATLSVDTAEHRMSREESQRRNKAIDKAVLSVLTERHGEELTVATIAGRLAAEGMAVDNRGVSISLQRILKTPRLGWSLIPGKKGRWRAEAKLKASQPAENGMHAEHRLDPEEPPFDPADGEAKLPAAGSVDEDDASALEEAGVVSGGADPMDYGWR